MKPLRLLALCWPLFACRAQPPPPGPGHPQAPARAPADAGLLTFRQLREGNATITEERWGDRLVRRVLSYPLEPGGQREEVEVYSSHDGEPVLRTTTITRWGGKETIIEEAGQPGGPWRKMREETRQQPPDLIDSTDSFR